MPHLVACPSCARHVRVSEAACPFCGVVLAESLRQGAPPRRPGVRLTRAAVFALGTGTVALTPSCSSSSGGPVSGSAPVPDAADVGYDDAANVIVADAYGTPAFDAAGDDGNDGADDPVDTPVYGGPGLNDDDGPNVGGDAADANVGGDAADGSPGLGLNDAGDSGQD
jgi:hypothetical protein